MIDRFIRGETPKDSNYHSSSWSIECVLILRLNLNREITMLSSFYLNTLAVFKQLFETMPLALKPVPVPVRIRLDETARLPKLTARQQRALHSKYRA